MIPLRANALSSDIYATESVLGSGSWVKIKVTETGIHSITKSDITKWGFSDISKVQIFGYGGAPISEVLTADFIDDLPQVPILRTDSGDILFYAQSHESWSYSSSSSLKFTQVQHPYAQAGYYFVVEGDYADISPEDITQSVVSGTDNNYITSFIERKYHEQELYSVGSTGRALLGEDFKYSTSQTFNFTLDNLVDDSEVVVTTSFGAKITGGTGLLSFKQNDTSISSSTAISASSSDYEHYKLVSATRTFTPTKSDLSYNVEFSYSGTLVAARLNYITINYWRELKLDDSQLVFNNIITSTSDILKVSGGDSNSYIWDISSSYAPKNIKYTLSGSDILFTPTISGLNSYIAFNSDGTFPTPEYVSDVVTQNIHARSTPNMVIVSPTEYLTDAERLAELRRSNDNMDVVVLTPDQIYNEFSSGTPDIMAIRKMLKMWYDRGSADGDGLKYLLLFGRGSYDNRAITETVKSYGYPLLPTWQSEAGDNENSSYTTDDFYGFLDDNSGSSLSSDKLSIAVGRMPIKSSTEADETVDKLYSYVENKDSGAWKNNLLMIADDEDSAAHMIQTDAQIANMKSNGGDKYLYNYLYTDAYASVSSGSGRSYPDARKQMFQKLDEGQLWVNYIGHANTVGWTHEGLLNITDIEDMYLSHLPLFYTATCEFTRWDGASVSAGELLFLNSRGGAIALISTTRLAYVSDNGTISAKVGNEIFSKDDNGEYKRIGDILKDAKNSISSSSNKLRYAVCGDPSLRLAYPTYNITLDKINGQQLSEDNMQTIKARETVTITGTVYDVNGDKATDYNGVLTPTLYDSEISIETYGNGDGGVQYVYYDRSNKLYVGADSIRNGEFEVTFSMPTEINNNYSPAMFSFYSCDDNSIEGNGASYDLYVYGYDESAELDTIGPTIEYVVLNSTDFKDGDTVNETPMLMAAFTDESGINISTSGIGHQMTILIDGKTLYTDVSQYYTPSMYDNGGTVNYPIDELEDGEHTLRFKVWDIANNSSEQTITFTVIKGLTPDIASVYTTTNPVSDLAEFYVEHNRPDAILDVTLTIYNLMGRMVWSATETGKSDMFTSFPIEWDLTDTSGRRVPQGIYIYRAEISTDDSSSATASKKIMVISQ
ncbi:MAG: type IX secretion system sortase PorU [Bacteroidales bacterium]